MFSFLAQTETPAPAGADVPPAESPEAAAGFFVDIYQRVMDALMDKVNQFAAFLPDLIIAVVLLVIGLIVAKIVRNVLTKVFTKIKLDDLLDKLGIGQLFGKMGIQSGPSEFLPKLIYLVILVVVIQVAAQAAGIEDVSELIGKILAFSPRVVTAIIILLVGFIVAELVSNAVERALDNFGLDYARTLAKILFGFIFILFLTVALPQLEIETELLNATVKIMLGGLAVALALALGLGLKALAHDIVAGVYVRDLYKVGTEIEVDDETATVAGVGPITTKLQRPDGGFFIIANHLLVSDKIRGRSAE
ncbi:MAG: mechanosensitive ion channel [Akkermansiaceae bacterium]|nr:mechanosensitive ion channel [Akkermansiaceae bacterium]